jgi:DNA repair exonuclease SbcCD nuclease subunit
VKFVHAADLHLDSPLSGLERYEGAPIEALRLATRSAMKNLIELCLEQGVELVLLAGDLFDDDWRDYSSGLFFASELARLREVGTKVVWIRGNHDALSKVTRQLKLPAGVYELSPRRPETLVFEELGIAVHGQGFAKAAMTEDLTRSYPAPLAGMFNVGLLHTSVDGREGHARYAPCRLETLVNHGYDYWALGHVHRREVLHREPWVVFPGNLQGRHIRETGAKGATLVSLDAGRVAQVEPVALDVVRWERCSADVTDSQTPDDVLNRVRGELEQALARADGRLLAARVVVSGTTRAHAALGRDADRWLNEIRAAAIDLGSGGLWLEQVRLETRGALGLDALATQDDAVSDLARAFAELRTEENAFSEVARELSELRQKLPLELRRGAGGLDLDDPASLRALVDDIEQLVLPRLLSLEEP